MATQLTSTDFGDHFILHLSGPALTDIDRDLLRSVKPIGIFLDGKNFLHEAGYTEWIEALRELLEGARSLSGRDKLIVSLDHEGGRVIRTPDPITRLPYPAHYASVADSIGSLVATQVQSLGVNLLFGPSVDINSNLDNPVIGERAFGTNVDTVVSAAKKYIGALHGCEVTSCIKHFPGHGDTAEDSHFELPALEYSKEELLNREVRPFRELIQFGAPCVMTSHVLFKALDPDRPATLSKKVIQSLLREELGFDGVVITDDIDMRGLSDSFSEEEIALGVMQAGCDVFLFNHHPERALEFCEILQRAVQKGQLSKDWLQASSQRVDQLVNHWIKVSEVHQLDEHTLEEHAALVASILA